MSEDAAPQDEGASRSPPWSAPEQGRAEPARPDLVKRPAAPPGPGPVDRPAGTPLAAPPGWGGAPPGWGGAPPPLAGRPVVGDRRGIVPLRPLGLGDLIDAAFAVVRSYWRPVYAVGAVVSVAGALLELLVVLTLLRPVLPGAATPEGTLTASVEQAASASGGLAVTLLFLSAAALLLAGLVAPAVSRGTLAQPLTLRELWVQVRPRLGPLVAVAVLVPVTVVLPFVAAGLLTAGAVAAFGGAGALVGLLALPAGIALGVLLYVRWSFAPLCVVLERQGVRAALARSSVLVKGSWWRVLGVLLLTALVASAVAQVLQLPFLLLTGDPLGALSLTGVGLGTLLLTSLGGLVAAVVVDPFAAAVVGLLYVDRRMRSEGLDVALAAATARP